MSRNSDTVTALQGSGENVIAEKVEVATQLGENAIQHSDGLSILSLIVDASLIVQFVMLLLLAASVLSWSIIFIKRSTLKHERDLADKFEKEFWMGGSMQLIYNKWSDEDVDKTGLSEIFVAGFTEYARWVERDISMANDVINAVHRAMRVQLGKEIESLESRTSLLATIGSTSPYVGLFGTVWGIMNSFHSLATSKQQATIASVAPGIAEALIATAMGLLAAIPAVIAYNQFFETSEKLIGRYEVFMEEFLSLINRELVSVQKNNESAA